MADLLLRGLSTYPCSVLLIAVCSYEKGAGGILISPRQGSRNISLLMESQDLYNNQVRLSIRTNFFCFA